MMYWVLLVAMLSPSLSWGQTYSTLTMVRPIATGTAGSGLNANNRIYRAYTGLTYKIHADAIGGKWPYTYALSNAPSGMTIEAGPCTTIGTSCTAGTITWANPTTTASNITVTITDSLGAQVSGTWSVTVGTSGFCFVDAVSGNDANTGTAASPWQTLDAARTGCGANSIMYLRAGTYNTSALTGTVDGGSAGYRKKSGWSESSRPVIWIGYPGDARPVIEFGATGLNEVEMIDFTGSNIWVEGIKVQNIGCIGFRSLRNSNYGLVVRDVIGQSINDGYDSGNCSFFMWQSQYDPSGAHSYYDTVQLSSFIDANGGDCALKIYSVRWGLFETNAISDSQTAEGAIALKAEVPDYTVRANTCASDVLTCIGGNMNRNASHGTFQTGGEVLHNLCLGSGTASAEGCITLVEAEVNPATLTQVYRNTFIGRVLFTNADTGDGPYRFYDNVILNADNVGGSCPQYYYCVSVTDYTVLVDNGDNVKGANDGTIANATTGALVGSYRTTYLGVAGYELAAAAATTNGAIDLRGGVRWNGGVIWR